MKSEEELMKNIKNWRKNKLYQGIVNNNQKISLCEENKTLLEETINDIISRRNVSELIRFTQNVIGFSLDDLTDKIIQTYDIDHIYYFIRNVKNALVEKMTDEIIRTYNMEKIKRLAKRLGVSVQEFYQT